MKNGWKKWMAVGFVTAVIGIAVWHRWGPMRPAPIAADANRAVVRESPTGGGNPAGPVAPSAWPPSETLPRVEEYALSRFDDVELDRDPELGTPHFIRRRAGYLSPPAPGVEPPAILARFIEANARMMTLHPSDLAGENAYVASDFRTPGSGMRHLRWQQRHEGLDIFGARLAMNLTEDQRIINVSSRALYVPSLIFHRDEQLDQAEAVRIARATLGGGAIEQTFALRRVWYPLDMITMVMSWEVALEVGATPRRTTS